MPKRIADDHQTFRDIVSTPETREKLKEMIQKGILFGQVRTSMSSIVPDECEYEDPPRKKKPMKYRSIDDEWETGHEEAFERDVRQAGDGCGPA